MISCFVSDEVLRVFLASFSSIDWLRIRNKLNIEICIKGGSIALVVIMFKLILSLFIVEEGTKSHKEKEIQRLLGSKISILIFLKVKSII